MWLQLLPDTLVTQESGDPAAIARITVFADPGLLTRFGFPPVLPGRD